MAFYPKISWAKKLVARPTEDVVISQRAAQRIVGDAEIISAFEEVGNAYLAQLANSAPLEGEKRNVAYYSYKAIRDVFGCLEQRANRAYARDLKAAQEANEAENG